MHTVLRVCVCVCISILHAACLWSRTAAVCTPTCVCVHVCVCVQAEGIDSQLGQWLEVLATVLYRPKGRHAAEPFCAALALCGDKPQARAQHTALRSSALCAQPCVAQLYLTSQLKD